MDKKRLGIIFRFIQAAVFLVLIGYAAWKLWGIYQEYQGGTKTYDILIERYVSEVETTAQEEGAEPAEDEKASSEGEAGPPAISVDFDALKAENPDIVGWIYCADTPVNYPIVQSEDNDYYLYRLPDGQENKNGTIFMDYRNKPDFSDWNTLIYGHNMKNGAMFGIVPNYIEQSYYEEHPVWYLLTEEKTYAIRLIGGFVESTQNAEYMFPSSPAERDVLYEKASRTSSFQSGVIIRPQEKLITMATCVYDYEDARYVLVGVLREVVLSE